MDSSYASPAEEKVVRKKKYEPVDKDYCLSNISIDEAENGVVIGCRYKLDDAVKDKLRGDHIDTWQYENDEEKHVFENKASAIKFIIDELNEMWG